MRPRRGNVICAPRDFSGSETLQRNDPQPTAMRISGCFSAVWKMIWNAANFAARAGRRRCSCRIWLSSGKNYYPELLTICKQAGFKRAGGGG